MLRDARVGSTANWCVLDTAKAEKARNLQWLVKVSIDENNDPGTRFWRLHPGKRQKGGKAPAMINWVLHSSSCSLYQQSFLLIMFLPSLHVSIQKEKKVNQKEEVSKEGISFPFLLLIKSFPSPLTIVVVEERFVAMTNTMNYCCSPLFKKIFLHSRNSLFTRRNWLKERIKEGRERSNNNLIKRAPDWAQGLDHFFDGIFNNNSFCCLSSGLFVAVCKL